MPDAALACSVCGASLPDQTNDTTGAHAAPELELGFAGASRVEAPSADLPSWLQSFAEVTGEDSVDLMPAADAAPVEVSTPETPLAASVHPAVSASTAEPYADGAGSLLDVGTNGFLTDDDLPGWLRALGTDDAPSATRAVPAERAAATQAAPAVPTISRAWVSGNVSEGSTPEASLFASVAHSLDARPESVAGSGADVPGSASHSLHASPRPAVVQSTVVTAASRDGHWSRSRLWLMTAVIVLSALMIIVMFSNMSN
jgi:hypothetical protein